MPQMNLSVVRCKNCVCVILVDNVLQVFYFCFIGFEETVAAAAAGGVTHKLAKAPIVKQTKLKSFVAPSFLLLFKLLLAICLRLANLCLTFLRCFLGWRL